MQRLVSRKISCADAVPLFLVLFVILNARWPVESIGSLTVNIAGARSLKPKVGAFGINQSVNAYCKVLLGDVEKVTEMKPNDINPTWNETFTFDLTDITGDLRVLCYDKSNGGKDRYLGQVIIPLVDFLPAFAPKNATLPQNISYYELFPLPPDEKHFRTAVEEMPDTAMKRPAISRGEVLVSTQIKLTEQIHQSYWKVRTAGDAVC